MVPQEWSGKRAARNRETLGRDTSTVTRWLQKYRLGGLSSLLEIKKALLGERKNQFRCDAYGGKLRITQGGVRNRKGV